MRRPRHLLLALIAATLIATPPAAAAPATTVQRTIQDCRQPDNLLEFTFGEEHVVFPSPDEAPSQSGDPCGRRSGDGESLRLPPSASIVHVLQLSDFQIVDEESPARVEWLDATQRVPRLQPFSAAYRPQEALTTQVTEAMVRQARNAVSPVTGRRLDLTILTGDNADSQQYNETRWFIDILDGTAGPGNPDPEMEDPSLAEEAGADDGDGDATVTEPQEAGAGQGDGDAAAEQPRDRKIDPNSGIPTTGCEATPGSVYDGVRDSGRSGVVGDGGYYEPDSSTGERDDGDGYSPLRAENEAETPGRDVTVRDFPGLLERANDPFEAVGLDMPWYSAFGNHDALVQGNSPDAFFGPVGPGWALAPEAQEEEDPAFTAVATGCVKVLQPAAGVREEIDEMVAEIQALRADGLTSEEQADVDELTGAVLAKAQAAVSQPCDPDRDEGCVVDVVPPDPRRCFLPKDEPSIRLTAGTPCTTGSWIKQHFRTTGTPVGHGFAPSPAVPEGTSCAWPAKDPDCLAASYGRPPEADRNNDGYYSFTPRPGLRFLVLDTITDECASEFCSEGSVDDTQFRWLRRQLRMAETHGEYVLVFSHHTLRTTRFVSSDPTEAPLHYGQRFDRRNAANPQRQDGGETLEELYCRHDVVLAHVAGHEHENYVERHDCLDDSPPPPACLVPDVCRNPHFWQISTAAHIDWPQQARLIELVEMDGEMSLVLTMVDHAGPANPGGPPAASDQGHAPADVLRLASIARELAYNDFQGDRGARGGRHDRNVILPTDRRFPYPRE